MKSSSGNTGSQITELEEQIEEMSAWKDKVWKCYCLMCYKYLNSPTLVRSYIWKVIFWEG